MTVLVEAANESGYVARSFADAPEIDGLVYIETDLPLAVGEFCRVEISGAGEYDLYASPSR